LLFAYVAGECPPCAGLLGEVASLDVDVSTALEEEALLIGVELRVARRRLDLIATPQDAVGADGVQERRVEGAEDVVLDADALRPLPVEGVAL
jgi:hypothetical protein